MTQLETFIKDNNLTFEEGSRNSNLTILVGFGLFKNNTIEEIKNSIPDEYLEGVLSAEMFQEIERLYSYCSKNNYQKFWHTEIAQKQYKF